MGLQQADYTRQKGGGVKGKFVRNIGITSNIFVEYSNDTNLDSWKFHLITRIVEDIVHNGMMKYLATLQEPPRTCRRDRTIYVLVEMEAKGSVNPIVRLTKHENVPHVRVPSDTRDKKRNECTAYSCITTTR